MTTTDKYKVTTKTLSHPLGRFGEAKLIGLRSSGTPSETKAATIGMAFYIPKGNYNVSWVKEIESIFFPNTIITATAMMRLNSQIYQDNGGKVQADTIYISFNHIYMSPQPFSTAVDNGFYAGGFANTASGKLCCPSLQITTHKDPEFKSIFEEYEALKLAMKSKTLKNVRAVTENGSMKSLFNRTLIRFFNTNFNNDYWQTGWPMTRVLTNGSGMSVPGEKRTQALKEYAKLSEQDVMKLPVGKIRRTKLENMITIY